MESQFIEKKDTQYAYTCIHEFFSGFGLCGAIDYMESILHAALTEKIWNKASPYEAICFIGNMQLLCTAAFIIFINQSQKKLAVMDPFDTDRVEMPEVKSLTHKYVITDLWIHFPRSLTLKQYYNPYKAIKKFCNYRKEAQWKKTLEDCSEYALGRHTIQEAFLLMICLPSASICCN
jgi:hypothetical protein